MGQMIDRVRCGQRKHGVASARRQHCTECLLAHSTALSALDLSSLLVLVLVHLLPPFPLHTIEIDYSISYSLFVMHAVLNFSQTKLR